MCVLRVAARGFDGSSGTCAEPYDIMQQRDDFIAAIEVRTLLDPHTVYR